MEKARRLAHKCTCHGRSFCWWCIIQTAAFPLEHYMWEKAPGLRLITAKLGL